MKVIEIISLQEAGPFSYGYKKPKTGSVKDIAEKRRKEQEKRTPPIEPKNQWVGTARITNEAESDELKIGDPVKVTGGGTRFDGEVGVIDSFDSTKSFAVVNLVNHGKHSFHISNISFEENPPDEDDYQEDEERL